VWEELTRGAIPADSPSFISRARRARERAVKPRRISAGVLVAGCGVTFLLTAWRGGAFATSHVEEPPPRAVATLRADAPALPWVAEIRSRMHAPLPSPAEAPPGVAEGALTLAQPSAGPEPNVLEDGAAEDSGPGIGEPVEVEKYLEVRDRAAAHSARSR